MRLSHLVATAFAIAGALDYHARLSNPGSERRMSQP